MLMKKIACPHCGRIVGLSEPRPCMYCGMDITQEQMESAKAIEEKDAIAKNVSESLNRIAKAAPPQEPQTKGQKMVHSVGKFIFTAPYGLALMFGVLVILVGVIFISGRRTASQIDTSVSGEELRQKLNEMASKQYGVNNQPGQGGPSMVDLDVQKKMTMPLRALVMKYAQFHKSLPPMLDPDGNQLESFGDVQAALAPFKDHKIVSYTLKDTGEGKQQASIIMLADQQGRDIRLIVTWP